MSHRFGHARWLQTGPIRHRSANVDAEKSGIRCGLRFKRESKGTQKETNRTSQGNQRKGPATEKQTDAIHLSCIPLVLKGTHPCAQAFFSRPASQRLDARRRKGESPFAFPGTRCITGPHFQVICPKQIQTKKTNWTIPEVRAKVGTPPAPSFIHGWP